MKLARVQESMERIVRDFSQETIELGEARQQYQDARVAQDNAEAQVRYLQSVCDALVEKVQYTYLLGSARLGSPPPPLNLPLFAAILVPWGADAFCWWCW